MKTRENPTRNRTKSRNFAGQNLRGRSFQEQDLSGADFSGADLQGTNFTKAILKEANFTRAKCGLQKRRAVLLTILSWVMAAISGFFSVFLSGIVSWIFYSDSSDNQIKGWVSLLIIVIFLIVTIRKGIGSGAVAVTVAGAIGGVIGGAVADPSSVIVAVAVVIAVVIAVTGAGAGASAVVIAVIAAAVVTKVGIVAVASSVSISVSAAAAIAVVGRWIGWRAMKGNPRDAWIHDFAVAFATLGGTSFRGADLTEANFSAAKLKSTDMREANLTRVRWYGANMLDRVRPGDTYLQRNQVRQWLLGDGKNKNFDGQNLQGVNFQGVDLSNASFIGTNLGEADLGEATLTGACIQDWNINNQTKFEQVICDYIYLKAKEQERIPHDPHREFQSGEFEQYIKKALHTVDLIFTDGIDWKAFFASFQDLQSEYGTDQIGVQAIERKSRDAFVVRLEVPADANKAEIESKAKKTYDTELKKLETKYRAELQAKEKDINFHKQKSAEFYEILKLQASRPIQNNVNVDAKAESNPTMSETYQSKYDQSKANIGGFVDTAQFGSKQEFHQHNHTPEQKQNLAEAAAEIQQLLKQLAKTNPNANEAEQIKHINDETTPKFKRKAYAALKATRDTTLDELLDNSYAKIAKNAILAWIDS